MIDDARKTNSFLYNDTTFILGTWYLWKDKNNLMYTTQILAILARNLATDIQKAFKMRDNIDKSHFFFWTNRMVSSHCKNVQAQYGREQQREPTEMLKDSFVTIKAGRELAIMDT